VQDSQHDITKSLINIDEQVAKLTIERQLRLEDAFRSGDVNTIYKAEKYYTQLLRQQNKQGGTNLKSMLLDPLDSAASMGYYSKSASLSYQALRAMARTPIIRAIINTRKDQVAEHCKPQADRYSRGFVFKKRGVQEDDLTDQDRRTIERLTQFILSCGQDDRKWDLDDFETFVRKLVDDSLVLDQACFEIVPMRNQVPAQFLAVDAAMFRIADTYDTHNNKEKVNGYYPTYVQVYQGNIIAEFYPWELCFGVRNPSTNIYSANYGRSELEDLVQIVTSMLNSDKYNGNFFRHGSAPKGALLVKKGNVNPNTIAQLRRDWNAMLSGVDGAHKTPVLDAEAIEWLDLHKNNRDMEFSKFQEYLIRVACAVYKISPEEVGFPLGGTQNSGIGSKEGGAQEKEYSMNKGLRPLLGSIQAWVNKYVVGPLTNDQWIFEFAGLDAESIKDEEERLTKAAATYMEVNEVRVAKGLKPKKGYDIILNPIISQMRMMEQQQQMQLGENFQQQDEEEANNTNPFLDKGEIDNPFAKAFNQFCEQELLVK